MRLFFQVLMIVALLFCDSHQLRTRDALTSALRQIRAANGYSTGMGPYDIDVQLVRRCEDKGTNLLNDTMEVYNKKTEDGSKILYRGGFTMPLTQEQFNSLVSRILVYRLKDKKEFQMLKYEENLCQILTGHAKDVFARAKKEFGLEEGDECVIPEGSYTYNDWDIILKLPPPVMEYGSYRGTFEVFHEQEMVTCYAIFAEVKQKS